MDIYDRKSEYEKGNKRGSDKRITTSKERRVKLHDSGTRET